MAAGLPAQQWEWVQSWPGDGSESLDVLWVDEDGRMLIGGTFDETLSLEEPPVNTLGSNDVYLAQLDPEGSVQWSIYGGSHDNDRSVALKKDAMGNIYWTGSFFSLLEVDDWTLEAPEGGKSLFLTKLTPEGELSWCKAIDGSGSVVAGELALTAGEYVYLAGDFTDSLLLEDTVLVALGARDFFLLKYDSAGVLQWAANWGGEGEIHTRCLALETDGTVVAGGFMNGSLEVAGDLIQSQTNDEDGWVARVSPYGDGLWGRQVGAQYDERVNDLVVDTNGDIFVSGTFLGVLEIDGMLTITTQGFNTNFFLARIDKNGNPLWSKSLGGSENEEGLLLSYKNGPVVAGIFRESLTVQDLTIEGGTGTLNGFAAGFSPSGEVKWMLALPGTGFTIPAAMGFTSMGNLVLGGSFSEQAFFDNTILEAEGPFDLFLGEVLDEISMIRDNNVNQTGIRVFPNPAIDRMNIEPSNAFDRWRLLDARGQQVLSGYSQDVVRLGQLPVGVYYLQLFSEEHNRTIKVMKTGKP